MTPGRNAPWLARLRIVVPAAFVGYGLYVVSGSVILAVALAAAVLLLCWFLIHVYAPRSNGDDA